MVKHQRTYTPEFRQQMVELVRVGRKYDELAQEFGCSSWSIRQWVKRADRDAGRGDGGLTSDERRELTQLRRENRQLKLEREILAKAAGWLPEEIPAIPKYIQEWESPFDQGTPYPLQALGHHTLHRVHSTHDNNDWLEEAFPQRVFLNPLDARTRGIQDGADVMVFNQRGILVLPCRITPRIMPGVVDIPQGGWYEPDEKGIDRGGCVNVLTSQRWTPFAHASAQHTIMVQVEKTGPA